MILEGDNQKQATFLAKTLASVNPEKVNRLNMIMPAITMNEHLTIFEKASPKKLILHFPANNPKRFHKWWPTDK